VPSLFSTAALSVLLAGALQAQSPAPAAVLNPASNTPAGLPNSGIAQGSIFVVYGKNLGPATIATAPALPLPTTAGLAGTSVTVSVNGTIVTAPMVYTLATQVAAVLPSGTPVGAGTLTVTYNGASGTVPITVVQSNFGISSVNLSGSGPAVVTFPNFSVITVGNSAKPGDIVVLWGTGLGPIPGNDAAVPTPTDLGTPIQVYVGGKQATVSYRGRSAAPGLDQINFQVPAGLSGCYIPIAVQNGTTVSNFTTMAVAANGGACSDPNGLPTTTITGASGKGTLSLGVVSLFQSTITTPAIGPIPADTATTSGGSGIFYKFTSQQLSQSGSISGQPTIGGCLVTTISGVSTTASPAAVVSATGLNAGPSIAVAGPARFTLTPVAQVPGIYSGTVNGNLPGGTYTASNGAGGIDVGGFMTTVNLPPALTWTNQAATTSVNRSQGLPITWSGGDANSYVVISGSSISGIATTGPPISSVTSPVAGASFTCTAPVAAGQFTVPPVVLLSLPASVSISGIPTGVLSVGSFTNPQTFTATGLDYAYTISGTTNSALVNYQ
jgi:uncharacterized protein (TIGR03437 family)